MTSEGATGLVMGTQIIVQSFKRSQDGHRFMSSLQMQPWWRRRCSKITSTRGRRDSSSRHSQHSLPFLARFSCHWSIVRAPYPFNTTSYRHWRFKLLFVAWNKVRYRVTTVYRFAQRENRVIPRSQSIGQRFKRFPAWDTVQNHITVDYYSRHGVHHTCTFKFISTRNLSS